MQIEKKERRNKLKAQIVTKTEYQIVKKSEIGIVSKKLKLKI